MSTKIGLDSQCLTYLLSALHGIGAPQDSLALEKIALVRVFLSQRCLAITPTVKSECLRIADPSNRELHSSWIGALFETTSITHHGAVSQRIRELKEHHSGILDCSILAEAEDCAVEVLLTYDTKFVRRLGGRSPATRIYRPSEYWDKTALKMGAEINKVPERSNPLYEESWWRWRTP